MCGKKVKTFYLWINILFCGLVLEISTTRKVYFERSEFSNSKSELCGKESETILFVGKRSIWVSVRNFERKKRKWKCVGKKFCLWVSFFCWLAIEISNVRKVFFLCQNVIIRYRTMKKSKKYYLWVPKTDLFKPNS